MLVLTNIANLRYFFNVPEIIHYNAFVVEFYLRTSKPGLWSAILWMNCYEVAMKKIAMLIEIVNIIFFWC